jgi:hypothetical protein
MGLEREEIVERIRSQGFMVRLTEWHEGWQAGAFHRRHPAKYCAVTPWAGSEIEAWRLLDSSLEAARVALAADATAA